METPIYCLLLLNLVFRHVFSSDVEESARKISHHLGSECCYPDVTTRDLSAVPDCDLYIWGPPCQPFSKSGRQGGVDDQQNGQAILYGIAYIGAKRPAMFIMDQDTAFNFVEDYLDLTCVLWLPLDGVAVEQRAVWFATKAREALLGR